MKKGILALAAMFILSFVVSAADVITLPEPKKTGGKPLMDALAARRTDRTFSDKEISNEVLSNMLWAADGVNRPDGKRTAPSAVNYQEITIYVVTAKAVYSYDAKGNTLQPVVDGDLRAQTGVQPFVGTAPVNIVYVADFSKMGRTGEADKMRFASADTGFISQNVYLFCASEEMHTVVRASWDKNLGTALNLKPEQQIILAQTVGYPK